jgi:hypothetical protein
VGREKREQSKVMGNWEREEIVHVKRERERE